MIVKKLIDKSPFLLLYRTVTSYDSLFSSFVVIGYFSSFENLLPSSTLYRRITKTNSFMFSCSNGTLPIYDQKKEKIILFTKYMRVKLRSSNLIRTRDLSWSILLPLILLESERFFSSLNLFIWNLDSFIWFFNQKYYVKSLILPLPLSLSHRYSVWIKREPFFLYESILLQSKTFPMPPKKNPELDPKLAG